ncbi:DExH-box ATP-dependent RNA helicase DExH3 [Medicago truncatula]|nr:DExH-box ATP-dependent RNA helicase DExH3 [Medicago truncatula]
MTGWKDISRLRDGLQNHHLLGDRKSVLIQTCHGLMETFEQKLIFDKPPPNVRKIVLATNVAEASITINDIVFIIDCGKTNESSYDALNNTPCLLPSWISQASARQRRGRAGHVQPGECYHLYPKCVYEAFSEYQLPEILRTPLNSLCLQIKSLQVESIGKFLSSALEAPDPRAVQNAIEFLTTIGALDEDENLTNLGKVLSILPVDPKLGKMLIMGAIFRCFDPVLTIVSVLSVRDPFLMLQDKSELKRAKSRFSANDYSDHMVFVRAYEGWKDAKRERSDYNYCWRNFLSSQTLHEIHSIRKQLSSILKETGLLDTDASINNNLSIDQSLVRAVICSGLFPCIASVNQESIKTMDDGYVLLAEISVNSKQTIPYPWLVFNEKVKIKQVLIRDSTGVSDLMLILFGGALSNGKQPGHLKMLDGYVDFFMDPNLADCCLKLKGELDRLIQKKLEDPGIDFHKEGECVMYAVQELISGDQCEGRFVSARDSQKPKASDDENKFTKDGTNLS